MKEWVPSSSLSLFSPKCEEQLFASLLKWEEADERFPAWLQEGGEALQGTELFELCSIVQVERARLLAIWLIDEEGKLDRERLQQVIAQLQEALYSLRPGGQDEAPRQIYLLEVLSRLETDRTLERELMRFSRPHANRQAEELISQTLQLEDKQPITDAQARRAVLSAWLTYLRQNVGSCFATAPAIIIQRENPKHFLRDLYDLLNGGRLTRTVAGEQFVAPLSRSWGMGELKRPFSLVERGGEAIFHSVSLHEALLRAEFFSAESSFHERVELLKGELTPLFDRWLQERRGETSGEELLEHLLLHSVGLSREELAASRETFSVSLSSPSLLVSSLAGGGGKKRGKERSLEQRCAEYERRWSLAQSAFRARTDNALLKSWEFSLASFSEARADFSQWNLYASLGLKAEEPGGIGELLQRIIQENLDRYNAEVQKYQEQYEPLFGQQKYVEGKMRSCSSERELQFLKAEFYSLRAEIDGLIAKRDEVYNKASQYAELFPYLIKVYCGKFREYFQELYDPSVQEVSVGPYDDAPAGFRLVYKHGRENSALWTYIETANEYVDSLAQFFQATEVEIGSLEEMQGLKEDFSLLVSAIIAHVRTPSFLESALSRMAKAHGETLIANPLENLNRVRKKPWVYLSGGRVNTLLRCYYKLEEEPVEKKCTMESPMELFVFLLDLLKDLPPDQRNKFLSQRNCPMLMTSPTHAFILRPTLHPFICGWCENMRRNSYTWVRDEVLISQRNFLYQMRLSLKEQRFLLQRLGEEIPFLASSLKQLGRALSRGSLSPMDFRALCVESLSLPASLFSLLKDRLDALLYRSLPLTAASALQERIEQAIDQLSCLKREQKRKALAHFHQLAPAQLPSPFFSSQELTRLIHGLLLFTLQVTRSPINMRQAIGSLLQRARWALPAPHIFADTNWVRDFFAFVVNPGTGVLELWRTDCEGEMAFPMSPWKEQFGGEEKGEWSFYTNLRQYGL